MGENSIINCLSIDVEDYFQVSAFESVSPQETWDSYETRVEANTDVLLECLSDEGVHGTFFILGWVAERHPELIKRISAAGHEIASHGYNHQRLPRLSREQFRDEIRQSKSLLEDLSGQEVLGFRAPSYSIQASTLWALDELFEAGYRYDSSVFPIPHDFYGMAHWPDYPVNLVRNGDADWSPGTPIYPGGSIHSGGATDFFEVPIATLKFLGRQWPIAGGGYFRLYPYQFTKWGLRRLNHSDNKPFVFYLHPWEVDPEQPRMKGAPLKSRVRHYLNLRHTKNRFKQLLKDFEFRPIRECFLCEGPC